MSHLQTPGPAPVASGCGRCERSLDVLAQGKDAPCPCGGGLPSSHTSVPSQLSPTPRAPGQPLPFRRPQGSRLYHEAAPRPHTHDQREDNAATSVMSPPRPQSAIPSRSPPRSARARLWSVSSPAVSAGSWPPLAEATLSWGWRVGWWLPQRCGDTLTPAPQEGHLWK